MPYSGDIDYPRHALAYTRGRPLAETAAGTVLTPYVGRKVYFL